jgi:membrane protease subunit HflK
VETRFGRYSDTTGPGLSYHWPFPFESVQIVDVDQRRAEEIGYRSGGNRQGSLRSIPQEALMLTQDENIVDMRLSVQFQIQDPRAYLFNVQDPDLTLRQVVESSIREVVGKSTMDFVLTEGRSDIVAEVQEQSQEILNDYGKGLIITNVNLQDAQPPEEVQAAFADAIKAREDEQRLKNEAEAYANEVLPRARGQAARRLEEATAYRAQVIARAEGEASRFNQLLTEYQQAPAVTRERLYLEAMENVLSNASTVLVDVSQGNNLFYVPLDQFMRRRGFGNEPATENPGAPLAGPVPMGTGDDSATARFRDTRTRETR